MKILAIYLPKVKSPTPLYGDMESKMLIILRRHGRQGDKAEIMDTSLIFLIYPFAFP